MSTSPHETHLLDLHPSPHSFADDVIAGLKQTPKTLPCKYFYDARGSQLFDQICDLDEYYVTRTELSIMERFPDEMAEQLGSDVMLVEYGSGSSVKTRLLLDHLQTPAAYVPVDISRDHLQRTADQLSAIYPHIEILPTCADFTQPFQLPVPARIPSRTAVYFPGSTIGNFTPESAQQILRQIATLAGQGGGLLIGIDLQKDIGTIEAAYNDAAGVTAAFNLNLLTRMQRELGAEIDVDQFHHEAVYDPDRGRVEISLVSRSRQRVTVEHETFTIDPGERIRTEYSHKYTIDKFTELAAAAGLRRHRVWTDPDDYFAVVHLVVVPQHDNSEKP